MIETRLAAFKVERRTVAAAVFAGEHLEYAQLRQLASDSRKAESSAVGFAQWITDTLGIEVVALERVNQEPVSQRRTLTEAIVRSLGEEGIAAWRVQKIDLLSAYGIPALKTRQELRAIVHAFWPIVPAASIHGSTLDAAALGLYVQIQRALA